MGLAYYRVPGATLESLQALIEAHESDVLGPRARGYWVEQPDEYDYDAVRDAARQLDAAGKSHALATLELSEVQAHALGMLDIELPADDAPFRPTLFTTSALPDAVSRRMRIARRRLGTDPQRIADAIAEGETDERFRLYMVKQYRHLREALPLVWRFYDDAAQAGDAVLVVDLRARDLETPDAVELLSHYGN